MSTVDDKRLQDQVNAANNAGAVAASICDHYWAWVSPAGTRHSARLCMSCHAPDPDWLNEVHAARAYGEVGSGVCDCGLPSMHHDWGMVCATGNDFDPPLPDDDPPPCGSCGEPSIHVITLRGEPMPVCLRHLNHWRTPPDDTPPDTRSEVETLDGLAQALYAKDKTPGEGGWLLWEEHSEGVRDIWRRYARRFLASDWLAQHDAQVAAKALRDAARELTQGPDYHQRTSVFAKRLRDCADRIGGDRG